MSTARWLLAGALACAIPAASGAQELVDPTRPPSAPQQRGEAPGAQAAPQEARLQSVLLSRGRKLAVIDGETVALGGKVGAATLVSITESEVVLRDAGETQVLKLYPGIEKKPARTGSVRPRGVPK